MTIHPDPSTPAASNVRGAEYPRLHWAPGRST
jgi:hypothetical protein